ncbi:ribosomal protein S18 acetylase RimI-like enzyme [Methanococcus maripaludis]|uniref:Ribosomal protein S18 acetylase RimI-like enzyme n=1 Tax=Methanococcus maripaludis TaxID=39152 RepID=A0A7J9P616_METMI|nr:GNAT family N-acetyltransferase [Methanococcus maripaludis]MBA2858632.1 ribosomal protein S18 acetylase RimI-like enzyme [Methanococcus maripaludis]
MDIALLKRKNSLYFLKKFKNPLRHMKKVKKVEICKLEYSEHSKDTIEKKLPLFMDKYFKEFYPNIDKWYREKVVEDLKSNLRTVYVVKNENGNRILGVAITRKYSDKYLNKNPKFCSFYICKEIRNRGFGRKLFEKALTDLQENSGGNEIILTVPEERLYESWKDKSFKSFLEKYDFGEINRKHDYYRKGKSEYIFKK